MSQWIAFGQEMPPVGETIFVQFARTKGAPKRVRSTRWDGTSFHDIERTETLVGWSFMRGEQAKDTPEPHASTPLFFADPDTAPRGKYTAITLGALGIPDRMVLLLKGTQIGSHPAGGFLLTHPNHPPARVYADDGNFVVEVSR